MWTRMNQPNLFKFFASHLNTSKTGTKRLSLSTDGDCDSSPKKLKEDQGREVKSPMEDATNIKLKESMDMIETKRIEAKMKLLHKSTCGLIDNFGPSWFKALEIEFGKEYFKKLHDFVADERSSHTIYPTAENVFSWTKFCDFKGVNVVILGQDPYHGPNQAHGLCFSVLRPTRPPPSLVNIYKELREDIENFQQPSHGDLSGWARQGVLLLNAVLTVRAGQANSHKDKGWEKFTDGVIRLLSLQRRNLVFILWGAYAQKKGARIDKSKHLILKGPHPSPLSAHNGFFGCRHFSAANKYLKENGKTPIDWSDLP